MPHEKKMLGISRAEITFFICEMISILFFGLFTQYKDTTDPETPHSGEPRAQFLNADKYPMFQDIHVMVFIGFGFFLVFLKNYSWTSIGYTYLIASWAIQIAILFRGFWHQIIGYYIDSTRDWRKLELSIEYLIQADFAATAVLVTFGAILGKCSLFQLWCVATIEVFFYSVNEAIIVLIFKVIDFGGSMIIFTFGGFFGLSVALFYSRKNAIKDDEHIGFGNYFSDMISMSGTLFLFCFFPSFNAALATGPAILPNDPALTTGQYLIAGTAHHRAIINTYLSMACSVIATIFVSKFTHGGKLNMEIVLNASLAGGVAVAACASYIHIPFGAMIAGFVVGCFSAFCYAYLTPFLRNKIGLHDSCGVLYLFALPGFFGGIISCIVASYGKENFGINYYTFFTNQDNRGDGVQAGFQLAALALSIGIAVFTGLITGWLTSLSAFQPPKAYELFDDRYNWIDCTIEHEVLKQLKRDISESIQVSRAMPDQDPEEKHLSEDGHE